MAEFKVRLFGNDGDQGGPAIAEGLLTAPEPPEVVVFGTWHFVPSPHVKGWAKAPILTYRRVAPGALLAESKLEESGN